MPTWLSAWHPAAFRRLPGVGQYCRDILEIITRQYGYRRHARSANLVTLRLAGEPYCISRINANEAERW